MTLQKTKSRSRLCCRGCPTFETSRWLRWARPQQGQATGYICGRNSASGWRQTDTYESYGVRVCRVLERRSWPHAQASATPVSVGFLYIRYSDHTKVTVRDLLEVLVKQTIERHPTSLPLCNAVYARHIQEKTEPSTMELLGLLKRFSSELKLTTFYFLDALDEAPADVQLELLESLISLNVKLFITSRPMKLLEARFPNAHHFPIVAQDSDLDVHIGKEMSRSMELQAILTSASPGLEGRITLAIKRKCSG
ncbi:hypothetical protein BKA70DRAFT_1158947, partial [Coprinopsis sp. MPI-PUGE-AT-0042]